MVDCKFETVETSGLAASSGQVEIAPVYVSSSLSPEAERGP